MTVLAGAVLAQGCFGRVSLWIPEYDLEGTADQVADWRNFFNGCEATADALTLLHCR